MFNFLGGEAEGLHLPDHPMAHPPKKKSCPTFTPAVNVLLSGEVMPPGQKSLLECLRALS